MIPFFTRKSKPAVPPAPVVEDVDIDVVVDLDALEDDALELTDEDFVLLEESPPPPPISRSVLRAALAATPPARPTPPRPISEARLDTLRTKTLRAGLLRTDSQPPASQPEPVREAHPRAISRLMWDVDAEASVADECLASIAAAASHARASAPFISVAPPPSSSLPVRARDEVDALLEDASAIGVLPPPSLPPRSSSSRAIAPPSSPSSVALSPRLPPVSPPPFVRGTMPAVPVARISVPGVAEVSDANDAAETLPVPMKTPFARTTTDDERASRPSVVPKPAASVAPVTVQKNDATVIVVRERPRTAWVLAAAAIGALAAVTVMRVAAPRPSSTPAVAVEAPPARAPAATAAVVRFGEEEGVSIKVPPSTPASGPPPIASHAARPATLAAPRSAPHAPAHAPAGHPTRPKVSAPTPLPDGSLGLANEGKASASSMPAPAPTPLPLPPSGGRKRPLTPEQELAEAQLRAATMR